MSRSIRRALFQAAAALIVPAPAFALCAVSQCAPDGLQSTGAVYRVCMPEPSCWNGDLVIWAHGYVNEFQPVAIPEDQLKLPDGTSLPALINALGFAFATTSYAVNGLATLHGVNDVVDLVGVFTGLHGSPGHVYLVGASEGGHVTALGLERHPDVFDGGLAACGPIGNFQAQLDYFGDFRAMFDVFFPGVLPGMATSVPAFVIQNWDTFYVPFIKALLAARPGARDQLLAVTRAPFDAAKPATKEETILGLLWYNVFATNDGVARLFGSPYHNLNRWYSGSRNDLLLNLLVRRYAADTAALEEVSRNYETSGRLTRPVVTLHTLGDPIIPWTHEPIYTFKTFAAASPGFHVDLPVNRYGHCNFQAQEALVAFITMVFMAEGAPLVAAEQALADEATWAELMRKVRAPTP